MLTGRFTKADLTRSRSPRRWFAYAILAVYLVFAIVVQSVNPAFLSVRNITNILRSAGFMVIPAIGMTFVVIAGELDFSIGATAAFGGIVAGRLLEIGVPIPIAMFIGLLLGALVGFANGSIVARLRLPSVIITIGMFYLVRGLSTVVSQNSIIYPLPGSFQNIAQTDILGISPVVYLAAILAVAATVLLARTTFGSQLYATGSDPVAARLVGIRTRSVKLICFVASGALSALYGILIASRLGSAQTGVSSETEFLVLAAVIIGGTSPYGGYGGIRGTVIGVLFITATNNAMALIRTPSYLQSLVLGLLIIGVVAANHSRDRRDKPIADRERTER